MHSFDAVPFGCFIFFLLQCFSYQTGANYCDICSFITSRIFFSDIFMSNSVHDSVHRVAFITIAFRIIEITVMIQHRRITTDNQNKWPILRRISNYNRRQSMRDEVRWFRAKSGHPPNLRLFAIFWTRSIFHVEQHISTIFGVIFLNRVWGTHFGPTIDIRLN